MAENQKLLPINAQSLVKDYKPLQKQMDKLLEFAKEASKKNPEPSALVVYQPKPRVVDALVGNLSKAKMVMNFSKLKTKDIIKNQLKPVPQENGVVAQYPSLSAVRRQYEEEVGLDKVCRMVKILLTHVADAFNVEFSDDQYEELAVQVYAGYPFLTFEDLYVCFGQLKKKDIKKHLNPNIILNEVESYHKERMNLAAQINRETHMGQSDSMLADFDKRLSKPEHNSKNRFHYDKDADRITRF